LKFTLELLRGQQQRSRHLAAAVAQTAVLLIPAGGKLLLNHPVQPFDIAITTLSGSIVHQQVSEAIALRVAELNRWRPGGGLAFPFLRLATVAGYSRSRLARATFEALFRSGGARDRAQAEDAAAYYQDVVRVVCRPSPNHEYKQPIAVEADDMVTSLYSVDPETRPAP